MMPYVAYALFESLDVLTKAVETFDRECVRQIKANKEILAGFAERTVGQAALLNEELGFMGAAEVAMAAVEDKKTIRQIAEERKIPTDKLV
jgi:aspartate ammonia-lyase